MRIIVTDHSSYWESIHTEEHICILFAKLKYFFKRGYRVWAFPTIWMASMWYKLTGRRCYKGVNISFEKFDPKADQITYWQPWMNVN